MEEPKVETLAESENYAIWSSEDAENGEKFYHVELGSVTLHLFEEEWAEFIDLVMQAHR